MELTLGVIVTCDSVWSVPRPLAVTGSVGTPLCRFASRPVLGPSSRGQSRREDRPGRGGQRWPGTVCVASGTCRPWDTAREACARAVWPGVAARGHVEWQRRAAGARAGLAVLGLWRHQSRVCPVPGGENEAQIRAGLGRQRRGFLARPPGACRPVRATDLGPQVRREVMLGRPP